MEFDFSQNKEIDAETYAKVPDNFKAAYEETDGKYVITKAAQGLVEAVVGLSGALGKERKANKEIKEQKPIEAQLQEHLGFSNFEEAKTKFKEMSDVVAEGSKVDPAKIKADIEKTFNIALDAEKASTAKMKASLEKYMIEATAVKAIADAKGNATLLMPLIRDKVKLVSDGDEYVVRVADGEGDYRGNGKGGFMVVEDLVSEMKNSSDFGIAFESDNDSGTGPVDGRRPSAPQNPGNLKREDMSADQLLKQGLENRRK